MNMNGDVTYRDTIYHHRVAAVLKEATVTHLERIFPAFIETPKITSVSLTTPSGG
jgi:hypothetical protein